MAFTTSFLNGGTQVTAARMSHVMTLGRRDGLFTSPTLTVANNVLSISSFSGLVNQVLVDYVQDAGLDVTSLPGVGVSGNSYQGTLVVVTDPSKYVESKFAFLTGLYTQAELSEGQLAVAWLAYPGASVPLSSAQWSAYPTAAEERWLGSVGPTAFTLPNAIQVLNPDMAETTWRNTGTTDVTVTAIIPVPTGTRPARTLRFVGVLPTGCFIKALVGAANTVAGTLSTDVLALPLWSFYDAACAVPKAPIPQDLWSVTYIKAQVTIAAGATISFGTLGATDGVTVP